MVTTLGSGNREEIAALRTGDGELGKNFSVLAAQTEQWRRFELLTICGNLGTGKEKRLTTHNHKL